ncbi:hypothetical protein GOB93_02295 [Acetobacter musti]|uniref:Uncharacterized protein n=1 Tax=Acetobacter musti TaxID=864732 RepID=A0ABX0JLC8_9PROT|nr:hypothetical protein [Acetobacter musti]NHN83470.1 hypothetical protein [Acetobacter musti]
MMLLTNRRSEGLQPIPETSRRTDRETIRAFETQRLLQKPDCEISCYLWSIVQEDSEDAAFLKKGGTQKLLFFKGLLWGAF